MPPKKDDEPRRKYVELGNTIREKQHSTTLFFTLSLLANSAFGAWGIYLYFAVEGSCSRPIRELILGCAIVFTTTCFLTACMFVLVRGLFFNVIHHAGHADSGPAYTRVSDTDEEANEESSDNPEALTRPITDKIACAYCSFGCLICAFIMFVIYFFVILTWVLVENNDCKEKAPELFEQARKYLIGLCVLFVVHLVWYGLACRYCSALCDIYNVHQKYTTWSSARSQARQWQKSKNSKANREQAS